MLFPVLTIRDRIQTSGTLQQLLNAKSMQKYTFWKNIHCKIKQSILLLMAFIHFNTNYALVLTCIVPYIFSTAFVHSRFGRTQYSSVFTLVWWEHLVIHWTSAKNHSECSECIFRLTTQLRRMPICIHGVLDAPVKAQKHSVRAAVLRWSLHILWPDIFLILNSGKRKEYNAYALISATFHVQYSHCQMEAQMLLM